MLFHEITSKTMHVFIIIFVTNATTNTLTINQLIIARKQNITKLITILICRGVKIYEYHHDMRDRKHLHNTLPTKCRFDIFMVQKIVFNNRIGCYGSLM